MLELPAGMLDDDKGDLVGTAVREVSFSASFMLLFISYNLAFPAATVFHFTCIYN